MRTIATVCTLLIVAVAWTKPAAGSAEEDPHASLSVAELVTELDDDDADCRCRSIETLAGRGADALPAVPALTCALGDADGDVRAAAAAALGTLALEPDRVIPALVRALADETRSRHGPVWLVAGRALGQYGEAAVPSLIQTLKDERLHVLRGAMLGIVTVGPEAKEAVPQLIEILEKDDPNTRNFASNALIAIGPEAKAAVPALIRMLSSEDFHTQYWACRALGAIGADASLAAPELIELVEGGLASVRHNAAAALGNIGPVVGKEAVAVLIRALSDRVQVVRQQAVIALGKLGPLSAAAIPVIEQRLREFSFRPAANAAKTLWLLKPESEIAPCALLADLEGGNEPWATAEVLGEIGVRLGLIDEVTEILKSDNREARLYAAVALGEIGPEAASARSALEQTLQDEDEEVREAAQEALQKISNGPPAAR